MAAPSRSKPGPPQPGARDIPEELRTALAQEPAALARFQAMPPSHQREVVQHVAEAKQPSTRERRADRMVQDLLAGRIG
jgi:uncharacterized protein YdeI (YjbR/CyaY-like superfamily)